MILSRVYLRSTESGLRRLEWRSRSLAKAKTYSIAEVEWNGSQACPFQHPEDKRYHGYEYGCRDYVFTNPNGDKMALSDLSYHMIKNHGFFRWRQPIPSRSFEAGEFL